MKDVNRNIQISMYNEALCVDVHYFILHLTIIFVFFAN